MNFNIEPFKKLRIFKGQSDTGKVYHYTLVKEYPHFYLYRCKENGCLEAFNVGSLLALKEEQWKTKRK